MTATLLPRNPVPAYRKHKPSGRAVVTLNGRECYLGPHGTEVSRNEYDRLIGEWLANGRRTPEPSLNRPTLTVSELILRYWEHVKQHYVKRGKPTSEQSNIRSALRPVRRVYGHTPVAAFGPLALKAVRDQHIAAGLSRGTVNRYVRHVVRMFKWGVANELAEPTLLTSLRAVEGLRKGRTPAPEPEPVSTVADSVVDAIEPFVSRQVWTMIQLQRLTGMRPGEVISMRALDIQAEGDVWTYTPSDHKTEHHGRSRSIPLGPQAQRLLKQWWRPELEAYLFSPREAEEERNARRRERRQTPMPPSQQVRSRKPSKSRQSDRYSADSYRRTIHRGCDAAEVPRWFPNQLRHNAATHIRRKYGIEAARIILGHSLAVTSEIYAEMDQQQAVQIMRDIG